MARQKEVVEDVILRRLVTELANQVKSKGTHREQANQATNQF
jgi:hypothetical protein